MQNLYSSISSVALRDAGSNMRMQQLNACSRCNTM
jgi:hypothetical protein